MAESWMTGTAIGQGDDIYYDPATKKYYGYITGRRRDGRGRWKKSKERFIDDMVELTKGEISDFEKYRSGAQGGRYRGRGGASEYGGPGKARFETFDDTTGGKSDAKYRKSLMELSERWDRELVGGERGSARMDMINRRKQVMGQMRDRYKRGGGWGSL